MKHRELFRLLRQSGFESRLGHGSHLVWNHPSGARCITKNKGDVHERILHDALAAIKEAISE